MNVNQFLKVVGRCGKSYLHNGGPTSRLEEKITLLGKSYGFSVDVLATPTGLFISVKDGYKTYTDLERIGDTVNNFNDLLFYANLFDQLTSKEMTFAEVNEELDNFKTNRYPFMLVALAAFSIGFMASFLKFGFFYGAVVSGVITCMVFALKRPLARRLRYSSVFGDFFSCLLAFTLSAVVAYFTHLPPLLFVMGSLILIVPGLTLTSAISELAEHNFISGTVKLVRALLILVAMGVAYLLVQNIILLANIPSDVIVLQAEALPLASKAWFQALGSAFLISAFCVFFHIPWRAFPGAIFCGLASVLVLNQFSGGETFVLASFLASFTVGIISLFLARLHRWPSQIFSTPGVLILVPGLLALSAFYEISGLGEGQVAYRAALTAGAIVFGLLTARMPFRLYTDIDE